MSAILWRIVSELPLVRSKLFLAYTLTQVYSVSWGFLSHPQGIKLSLKYFLNKLFELWKCKNKSQKNLVTHNISSAQKLNS